MRAAPPPPERAVRRVDPLGGRGHEAQPVYPFAAIVGQTEQKQALLLAAANPRLRGVLLFGEKGTAKSTAARALAALLPSVRYRAGCPYRCDPDRPRLWCDGCRVRADAADAVAVQAAPFITLPLNATLDRVIGTIHWEHALRHGTAALQPGLLADANRGVLYVDEVNLLDESVVAAILDAAATGINQVCREGVGAWHPADFLLIGTMNAEEGPLRPQLLDRFGLAVCVEAETELAHRTALMQRRLAFEADPVAFGRAWDAEQQKLRADIVTVRARLARVRIPDAVMREIAAWSVSHGVAGHRADILLAEAARARAAWEGEPVVTRTHLERVSPFVLLHRQRDTPKGGEGGVPGPGRGDGTSAQPHADQRRLRLETPETGTRDDDAVGGEMTRGCQSQVGQMFRSPDGERPAGESTIGGQCTGEDDGPPQAITHRGSRTAPLRSAVTPIAEGLQAVHLLQERRGRRGKVKGQSGRRVAGDSAAKRGRYHRAYPDEAPTDLAIDATIRAAAVRTGLGPRPTGAQGLKVLRRDFHQKVRRQRTKALILFVVDASGSLGEEVMALSKGAVLALLRDAYQKRDRVALIAFRDYSAPLLLAPTNSPDLARRCLVDLPTGGRTPLTAGLVTAYKTIAQARRRDSHAPVTLVLLSDGRANIGLRETRGRPSVYHGGGDGHVWEEALRVGEALGRLEGLDVICVDTTPSHKPPSLLLDLAAHMRGRYVLLEHLLVPDLLGALAAAPPAPRRAMVVRLWQ